MKSAYKPSKREDTKKANRETILRAGQQVFSEIGLDACNVRDIIRASELSTGTFYNYFQTKEEVFDELLDAIILDIHKQAREIWLGALQISDDERMSHAFQEFFQIFQTNPEYLRFFLKNQHYVRDLRYNGKLSGLLKSLETDVESAIRTGKLPPFPVKLVTNILFGTVFEILAEMIQEPEKFQIHKISRQLANFFRGGILSLSLSQSSKPISSFLENLTNLPIAVLESLLQNSIFEGNEKKTKNKT